MTLGMWLTRDGKDLIVGIDYNKAEVWLYKEGIITANTSAIAKLWFDQGYLMGSQFS